MRAKYYFLILMLLIIVTAFVFCKKEENEIVQPAEQSAIQEEPLYTPQTPDEIKARMHLPREPRFPERIEEIKNSIVKGVVDKNGKLSNYFSNKNFVGMGELQKNAVIIKPDGEFVKGEGIAEYWTEKYGAPPEGVTMELQITTVYIHLTDTIACCKIPYKKDPKVIYDAVAYVYSQFKVITRSGGDILSNDNGGWMDPECHITGCQDVPCHDIW